MLTIQSVLARDMLALINAARAEQGLGALHLERNLNAAALDHTLWMIETDSFSHTGADDSNGLDRMSSAGFDLGSSWDWAENIGVQPQVYPPTLLNQVEAIMDRWLSSPTHSANILNPDYEVVGLGIYVAPLPADSGQTGIGLVVTQNFGRSNGIYDLDIEGTDGGETLRGATGNDQIVALAGDDLLLSGDGDDIVFAGLGNDSANAGEGNDLLIGEDGNDFLRGAEGNDTLQGDAGNDFLIADEGADDLQGGIGQDSLSGGDGDDVLAGDAGFDVLQGGTGNDTLMGGAQADNLFASGGDDLLQGGAGFDRLFGGIGSDTLEGGDGPDALFGNDGADFLFGQGGDDRNYGAGGNDFIQDAEGNDLLEAGAGFDTLNGGIGDDVLFGRFNADLFVFADAEGGFGHDTIGDFAATNPFERIDLSGVAAISDLTDLLSNHATQSGDDVLIDAGAGSSIRLLNVSLAQLDATDFTF